MHWINALERRLGHLAIPGLLRIVVAFNLLTYLLIKLQPATASHPGFASYLELRSDLILSGQIWRLFTYAFIPPVIIGSAFEYIFIFMYLNFLWLVGESLEQAWGSFRLNAYYLLGIVGTTLAALLFGALQVTGTYLNLTLLFAFATLFPDYPVLFMFVIPIKVKWVALLSAGYMLISLLAATASEKVAITISLTNYIIFFGPLWYRHMRERGRHAERQQQFQMAQHTEEDETLHQCKVCGRTEASSPELEFRVASDGEEYCEDHLPSRQREPVVPPPLPG